MIFDVMPVGPFQMNAYLVGCETTREAAIIDAGDQAEDLKSMVNQRGLTLTKILQTHGHMDHVGAIVPLKSELGAEVYIHAAEKPIYESAPMHGLMFGITGIQAPVPDVFVEEGQVVKVGNIEFQVIETPGHTPGGVVYYSQSEGLAFVGDTLFMGSIGRTDLPGGDFPTLERSLARLIKLPDPTRVLSGHGPETTIGHEKRTNPFILELNNTH